MSDSDRYGARLNELVHTMGTVAVSDTVYEDLMQSMKMLRERLQVLPSQLSNARAEKRELEDKVKLREAQVVAAIDFAAVGAKNKEARDNLTVLRVNEDTQYMALKNRYMVAQRSADALFEESESVRRQLNGCGQAAQLHSAYIVALSAASVTLTVPVDRVEADLEFAIDEEDNLMDELDF